MQIVTDDKVENVLCYRSRTHEPKIRAQQPREDIESSNNINNDKNNNNSNAEIDPIVIIDKFSYCISVLFVFLLITLFPQKRGFFLSWLYASLNLNGIYCYQCLILQYKCRKQYKCYAVVRFPSLSLSLSFNLTHTTHILRAVTALSLGFFYFC